MRIKSKVIYSGGMPFIARLTLGHLKLHLIMNDDLDGPHSHPWDFTSLILFGGY